MVFLLSDGLSFLPLLKPTPCILFFFFFPPLIFQHSLCPEDKWLVFGWFASFTIVLGKHIDVILMMEELEKKKVRYPNVQQHEPLLPH